ncbi:hypothetical protein [Labrys miyagiensis]|uniref:hypothetical protein n=1 Tax=Labrys miyagiensis TaxID=346912 RepID=UPI0024E14B57|nr:hypothetical protein [Labrys miyagiensis]
MEPGRETIRSVAFAIGYIAFGLSIGLFVVDLGSMHFAMAFRMLAPAILQAFSLFLFHDSFAVRRRGKDKAAASSAHLPHVG